MRCSSWNRTQASARRRRPGCLEAGIWKPFYRGFVCVNCLTLDQQDIRAGRNPPGDNGIGKLFREDPDDPPLHP